mmetsp:Transcript_30431/g.46427  ORF Transcript_30431/g.46427 Transcript_30431/m.46427 type:complete len:159 (-) Transcript_30431:557-1033(-)
MNILDKKDEEEEEPIYSKGEEKIKNFHLAQQKRRQNQNQDQNQYRYQTADLSQQKNAVLHKDTCTTSEGGVKAFLRHDHTIRSSKEEQEEDAFHAKMIQKAKKLGQKKSLLASTPPLVLDSKSRPSNNSTNTNKNVVVIFQGWARCFFQGRRMYPHNN